MGSRGFSKGINLTVVVFIMAAPSVQTRKSVLTAAFVRGVTNPALGSHSLSGAPLLGALDKVVEGAACMSQLIECVVIVRKFGPIELYVSFVLALV